MTHTLGRRLAAEGLGTAFLLAAVVGSGIMGERLAGGNTAIALLANSVATGCALATLIFVIGPISGAHFNPLVSIALAVEGEHPWREVPPYIAVQIAFALLGVGMAHAMFGEQLLMVSSKDRGGWAQAFSEVVATGGLILVILLCVRQRRPAGALVALYITAAYWFTASTSFANPAVTLARAATNTFAGIRPSDTPSFMVAQGIGLAFALYLVRVLWPKAQE